MPVLARRRYGRIGLAASAAALLIALLVFVPATDASEGLTVRNDAGVILLSTGPDADDNWIRYYADPSSPLDLSAFDAQQFIKVNRCKVTTPVDAAGDPGEETLLAITPFPAAEDLGLVSNGFGVRTKNNCATGNGQVDAAQSLTFALGGFFDSSYAIDRVEVDVEGKQNAELEYILNNNAGSDSRPINSASDNGADAGTNDNAVVAITGDEETDGATKLFTSITFSPTGNDKALVSIEGGGDGSVPDPDATERTGLGVNQTLFSLVTSETFDGDLLCGESADPTTIAAEGPALAGQVGRGDNLKSTEPCERIPYTFQIQDDSVLFDYLDSGEGAHFVVNIEWDPADVLVDPLNPPDRQINYFPDQDPNAYVTGLACVSRVFDANPNDPTPDVDDVYEHPTVDGEVVPWCLAGEQLVLTASGWQQIQWWDGTGDPRWK